MRRDRPTGPPVDVKAAGAVRPKGDELCVEESSVVREADDALGEARHAIGPVMPV